MLFLMKEFQQFLNLCRKINVFFTDQLNACNIQREISLHLLEISILHDCKLLNFLPPNTLICNCLSNSFSLNFLTCNSWLSQLPNLHHYIFLQSNVSLVVIAHLTHQHLASWTDLSAVLLKNLHEHQILKKKNPPFFGVAYKLML